MVKRDGFLSAAFIAGVATVVLPAVAFAYNPNDVPRDSAALNSLNQSGILPPGFYQAVNQRMAMSTYNSMPGMLGASAYSYPVWQGQVKMEKKAIDRLYGDGAISLPEAQLLSSQVKAQQNAGLSAAYGMPAATTSVCGQILNSVPVVSNASALQAIPMINQTPALQTLPVFNQSVGYPATIPVVNQTAAYPATIPLINQTPAYQPVSTPFFSNFAPAVNGYGTVSPWARLRSAVGM